MTRFARMWVIAVIAMAMLPLRGHAQVLTAVGDIGFVLASKPGDVVVLRASGRKEIAQPYLLLYAGDIVVVNGVHSSAQIRIAGDDPLLVDYEHRRAVVPSVENGSISAAAQTYIDRFRALFNTEPGLVPVYTVTRGETPIPLSYIRALPSSTQFVPVGTFSVTVIWRGLASTIRLGNQMKYSDGHGYATFDTQTLGSAAVLSVEGPRGSMLNWSVVVTKAEAPRPTWLAAGDLSERQRIVRAVWLLKDGPSPWHLFAISELAALSGRNFVAWRMWQAVKAGEL